MDNMLLMDNILSINEVYSPINISRLDFMNTYNWETPEEINKDIASRLVNIRKRKKISQEELSRISGVSFGSIKRFETSGQISFVSLTKLSIALECVGDIKNLFVEVPYNDIQEVIRENNNRKR